MYTYKINKEREERQKEESELDYLNAIFLSRWGSIPSEEIFWGWGSVLEGER